MLHFVCLNQICCHWFEYFLTNQKKCMMKMPSHQLGVLPHQLRRISKCGKLKVICFREASVKGVLIAEGTFHFQKFEEISHGSTFRYILANEWFHSGIFVWEPQIQYKSYLKILYKFSYQNEYNSSCERYILIGSFDKKNTKFANYCDKKEGLTV